MQQTQVESQPKSILPQLSISQVKCQFGQSSQLRMFQFKNYFYICHHLEEKNSHYLPKTPQHYSKWQSVLDSCLFPQTQTLSSLSSEPYLIRSRKRVLNYLHGYLNPRNKSRYSCYPKRKLRFIDVWGGK